MCSWCYGFSRTLTELINKLPESVQMRRLLGGLAIDTDEPMSKETESYVRSNWKLIEQRIPGVSFNYGFWTRCQPRRSTYPACRAVIAARAQGIQYDTEMTAAIQRAYYEQARNPSDSTTLIELASELGLDSDSFSTALFSDNTEQELMSEIAAAKQLGVTSYPSLVLQAGTAIWDIPVNYNDSDEMLELITSLIERNH
jgi:putative protein-disulfide isomerase